MQKFTSLLIFAGLAITIAALLLVQGGAADHRPPPRAGGAREAHRESGHQHGGDHAAGRDRDHALHRHGDHAHDHDAGHEHRRDADDDRDLHAVHGELHSGRSVKLEFQLISPEDSHTFFVVCTGGGFGIDHDVAERDGSHQMTFGGEMSPPNDDGRLAVHYEVKIRHENSIENAAATFQARGSAVVQIGKAQKLALLGDAVVQLTANWAD